MPSKAHMYISNDYLLQAATSHRGLTVSQTEAARKEAGTARKEAEAARREAQAALQQLSSQEGSTDILLAELQAAEAALRGSRTTCGNLLDEGRGLKAQVREAQAVGHR